jgi:predicted Zn-dependent peptidase
VLTQVFGGAFNSRLNKAVRVEKGLTYGARGGLAPSRFAGRFQASTFTKTPSTAEAVRIILREMERLRSSPVEKIELDQARAYLAGSFAGDRETPQAVVGDLWLIDQCGLPADHFERYLAAVRQTSAADLQRVASRLIQPEELIIVVVGEAGAIREDLEKIAPVTVVKPDESGEGPPGKAPGS